MGQTIEVEAKAVGDVAVFDTDRSITGQDGDSFDSLESSMDAAGPAADLATRLFELDEAVSPRVRRLEHGHGTARRRLGRRVARGRFGSDPRAVRLLRGLGRRGSRRRRRRRRSHRRGGRRSHRRRGRRGHRRWRGIRRWGRQRGSFSHRDGDDGPCEVVRAGFGRLRHHDATLPTLGGDRGGGSCHYREPGGGCCRLGRGEIGSGNGRHQQRAFGSVRHAGMDLDHPELAAVTVHQVFLDDGAVGVGDDALA